MNRKKKYPNNKWFTEECGSLRKNYFQTKNKLKSTRDAQTRKALELELDDVGKKYRNVIIKMK